MKLKNRKETRLKEMPTPDGFKYACGDCGALFSEMVETTLGVSNLEEVQGLFDKIGVPYEADSQYRENDMVFPTKRRYWRLCAEFGAPNGDTVQNHIELFFNKEGKLVK